MTVGYPPLHGKKVEDDVGLFNDLNMKIGAEYMFNKFTVKNPLGKLKSNLSRNSKITKILIKMASLNSLLPIPLRSRTLCYTFH